MASISVTRIPTIITVKMMNAVLPSEIGAIASMFVLSSLRRVRTRPGPSPR